MRILYDLSARGSWGDKSLAIGPAARDALMGNSVDFRLGNWNNPVPIEGYIPSPGRGDMYTFCPGVEPRSFFMDLVVPTLGSHVFHVPGEKGWEDVPDTLPDQYDRVHCTRAWGELYTAPMSRIKWKITDRLSADPSLASLSMEMSQTRNFILYATWNSKRSRSHGVITEQQHSAIRSLVRELDDHCARSSSDRIVLVSKNADEWPSLLRSRYMDLRYVERDYGMPFSVSLYLASCLSHATIGEISSMQLWLGLDDRPRHYSWSNGWNRGSGALDWVSYDAGRPSLAQVLS